MPIKILVIEDDKQILKDIEQHFKYEKDYDLKQTEHGEEGFHLINQFHPHIVILDIMLPEIDGFEIAQKINQISENKRPFIILLTALSGLLDKMESDWMNKTGAFDLMSKPIDYVHLNSILKKLNNHSEFKQRFPDL